MCKKLILILFVSLLLNTKAQNDFDKYGPFGSQIYTDLKTALDIESKVYKLDLSYKQLDTKLFSKLGKLKDLQAIKLSGNQISSYPIDFEELSNLVYFASYNNEFSAFLPEPKKLYNLHYVEFFASKIDSIPADIAYLSKLKTLKISSTNDTLKIPVTLKYLKNLKELTIENCILDSFPKEIFKIPNLNYLNLTNTQLYKISSYTEKWTNLEVLVLDANNLTVLPYTIYQAKKLRVLSVKNNKLKKLPDTISQLENLTLLDIRGNSFNHKYIDELKALLPGCEIRN